jgi:DNA-binding transcriptional regulator YbjK
MPSAASALGTRDAILDAAERTLQRFGYRKMSIDDVAKAAGVGKSTIYLHFKDKADVALSSLERTMTRAQEVMRAIAKESGDPAERLKRMLEVRVMAVVGAVQHYHEGLDELFAAIRNEYMTRRREHYLREIEILSPVLLEGRENGAFAFESEFDCANVLLLCTSSMLPYSLSVREMGTPEKIEAWLHKIIDLNLNGLMPGPRRP